MKKYYRLCKNLSEIKKFVKDLKEVTGTEFRYDHFLNQSSGWYPVYIGSSEGGRSVGHMPIKQGNLCGKKWYEDNGWENLESLNKPCSKECITQKIFTETGYTVTKVKGNMYKVEVSGGHLYFRISVMEKDGGVDLKYARWARDYDLVVEGEGALKVAERVAASDKYAHKSIFTVEEFINRIKG